MLRSYSFSTDTLPVPEALFAELLRCAPGGVAAVAARLSEPTRARLALFCNARAHLRHLGHSIADTCSDAALAREGGQAGIFLADRNRRETEKAAQAIKLARPISLAIATSATASRS